MGTTTNNHEDEMPDYWAIGDALADRLAETDMSQADLAAATAMAYDEISNWMRMRGKKSMVKALSELHHFERALGLLPGQLLEDVGVFDRSASVSLEDAIRRDTRISRGWKDTLGRSLRAALKDGPDSD